MRRSTSGQVVVAALVVAFAALACGDSPPRAPTTATPVDALIGQYSLNGYCGMPGASGRSPEPVVSGQHRPAWRLDGTTVHASIGGQIWSSPAKYRNDRETRDVRRRHNKNDFH